MPLLAEYALIPDVFDVTSYSSDEVCGLHLDKLKEVLLQEGLVRDLRDGEWIKHFHEAGRPWHQHGKELLKKLRTQRRVVPAKAALLQSPTSDAGWCDEALASHARGPLTGIITGNATAVPHSGTAVVSSIAKLTSAAWWISRSPSCRVARTLGDYQVALDLVLRHANSLLFIDPYIDPTDVHQYGDLMKLMTGLQHRSLKPLVEVHRAAWYGPGTDKRPKVNDVVAALQPRLASIAKATGIAFDVFLWDEIHDRFLISDLIGISLPHGFTTTRAPNASTTWTRLGRDDRDAVQRDFDASYRRPRHRFAVP
jgi:hypothetical protein